MSNHTPGPWRVQGVMPDGALIVRAADHWPALVPEFNEISREPEQTANARLIAAAPDLLAALKNMLACMEARDMDSMANAANDACEVVAKAEGRK